MSANPLTSTLAALLESAANAALGAGAAAHAAGGAHSDNGARAGIAQLDGQVLLLELTTLPNAPPLAIRINCLAADGGSLRVMADSPHNTSAPNAIVRGSVADVIAALVRDDLPPDITIEGDERLLMALKRCFGDLQPDWRNRFDEFVERVQGFGGINSAPIISDLLGQAELTFDTLRTSVGDLFGTTGSRARSESAKFWAQESDLDDFATRLEQLQLEVDRLHAQLDYVANQRASATARGTNKE